jgi:transposase
MGKKKSILDYLHKRITNGFTEGCYVKTKMLEGASYGSRNIYDHWRKLLLKLVSTRSSFHTIGKELRND